MSPSRRRLLQATTPAVLVGLAGCTSGEFSGSDQSTEYTLSIDTVVSSPIEHTLYEPSDDALFGDPARAALADIIPDGTHTTYGYTPVQDGNYVAGEAAYFQVDTAVTGRQEMDRTLIRAASLDNAADESDGDDGGERPGEEAIHVDTLDRPSGRVIKILHSNSATGGAGASSDLLRKDAYVLRRPAERESELATGDLDGQIVSMTEDGGFSYRVSVTTESIREPEYTTRAIRIADNDAEFREMVFAAKIDAELNGESLSVDAGDLLDRTLGREHTESTPLSTAFERLLVALGLADVDESVNGRLLWYEESLYRYGLYINPN